ncbi:MAG: metal-dependent hydrolase, partial [Caulobacteraceae bacterium]
FDALSPFFPAGERFFVASVKRHKRFAKDERLRADVAAFCAQEGVHAREHERYNAMLAARGYPIADMEARVEKILADATRDLPPRWQLAVTASLEHFTALMARLVLGDDAVLDGAHPTMAALWRWHAAEESEHKSVAYDLYVASGGNWPERSLVMAVATVIFWSKVVEHQARMMATDGTATSPREWAALLKFLFIEPGGMFGLARRYLDFYRPGFHPGKLDDGAVLAKWEAATSAA